MRKVTALIVCKRKVAGATKKVAVATFARAKKKNNPKPEFWIDRKKVAAATFFPRAKVAAATFVGATQTCSHFGLPTWTIGGTCVLLYTETGHFRSQPKECLKLMSTMLDTLKRKHLVRKKPTVLSTTLLSTTSTLLKLKKKLRPGGARARYDASKLCLTCVPRSTSCCCERA